MLVHRLRHWPNIKPPLDQHLVFAELLHNEVVHTLQYMHCTVVTYLHIIHGSLGRIDII